MTGWSRPTKRVRWAVEDVPALLSAVEGLTRLDCCKTCCASSAQSVPYVMEVRVEFLVGVMPSGRSAVSRRNRLNCGRSEPLRLEVGGVIINSVNAYRSFYVDALVYVFLGFNAGISKGLELLCGEFRGESDF